MSFDPISIIEQGYLPCLDRMGWLRRMTPVVTAPLDSDGFGSLSYFLTPEGLHHATCTAPHGPPSTAPRVDPLADTLRSLSPKDVQNLLRASRSPGLFSLKEALGYFPLKSAPNGIADSPAVVIRTGDSSPAVMATLTRSSLRVSLSDRMLWFHLAIHLAAGCRLAGRKSDPQAEDVEAVLSPSGDALHARGPACSAATRSALRDAAQAMDRARVRKGRSDPLAALELWRGLLLGRYTMVEHFESDGRRFILARRNDPVASPGLSARQRQVIFYASLGWSNKESVTPSAWVSRLSARIFAEPWVRWGFRLEATW